MRAVPMGPLAQTQAVTLAAARISAALILQRGRTTSAAAQKVTRAGKAALATATVRALAAATTAKAAAVMATVPGLTAVTMARAVAVATAVMVAQAEAATVAPSAEEISVAAKG